MAPCEGHRVRDRGSDAAALLVELGLTPKLTIYLGGAPGAGKTHRLIADALGEAKAGRRVGIGWIETKQRPQLETLAAALLLLGSQGNLRTTTMRGFTSDEMRGVLAKAG